MHFIRVRGPPHRILLQQLRPVRDRGWAEGAADRDREGIQADEPEHWWPGYAEDDVCREGLEVGVWALQECGAAVCEGRGAEDDVEEVEADIFGPEGGPGVA